jgi:hypothetical protein
MYRKCNEKMRMGIVWAKGDEDACRLIKKFFEYEFFLKRIVLLFMKTKKHESQKKMSLLGFYE